MTDRKYDSMQNYFQLKRRDFLKTTCITGIGIMLGNADQLLAQDKKDKPKTNINNVLNIPKNKLSLPGLFPGRLVSVSNENAMPKGKPDAKVIKQMFFDGLAALTGKDKKNAYNMFFGKEDVIGIKVNPVGAGLISTRVELVEAVIDWLTENGTKMENIVIWDRFDDMLGEAGFTADRFPGVKIEALQTMADLEKDKESGSFLDKKGNHISLPNFDPDVYYWADIEAPQDIPYLNQHVVNDKYSYFGKLISQKLTKIINIPVFKNTGNGISMATKNIGYGAICNTGRLHKPLFFDVCTEVLAFPVIRDKMVLNIMDGLRAQYDGGPMPNSNFTYDYNTIFLATDPIAMDLTCHNLMVEKRKTMGVKVNEHPMFTEYLFYAEKLGLGIADRTKIEYIHI